MNYELHSPEEAGSDPTIILAHGFRRDLTTQRGWAEQWSALGFPVVIPSMCNSSWLRGRHDRNAEDLRALREHLGLERVIYAGFSAGGLSAYLAALDDPATQAYLGLDPVDSGDRAQDREALLGVPVLILQAEPSSCNARLNFQPVIDRYPPGTAARVDGATHCHFERPYDPRCSWVCGRRSDEETTTVQDNVAQRIKAWLRQWSVNPD